MSHLTEEHINYIVRDLTYRGLVEEGIRQEVLDHICLAVEKEMEAGRRFFDAYQSALKAFGNSGGIRRIQHEIIHTKTRGMLKNYLQIALRNHMKNKFYTFINVTGLAVGIASCLIIVLFIVHELSYDRHHDKADRIFRVNTEIKFGSVHHHLALASTSLAELFQQNFPEVESTVRLWSWGHRFVRTPESTERFSENLVWGDSTFFKVFTVRVLAGDPKTALKEPNSIAIGRRMAEKYFPGVNPLNRSLILDDDLNYRVTAVYEDMPDNGHFHFDMIRSISGLGEAKNVSLVGGAELTLYLLLREGADPSALESKFPEFIETFVAPQLAAALQNDFSMEKFRQEGNRWRYSLTPVTDIHLHSDMTGELEANSDIAYVYLFASIALFILVIACINFMNLSTARSADRAREVGIRKVMGSLRTHLVRQFLTESTLLTILSFVLAVAIAYLFLPVFNDLAQKKLSLPLGEYRFYLVLTTGALIVGICAGLYPSFFLSAFKPVNVLKGKLSRETGGSFVRSGLVVFQFVISIFLIVATITVQRQLAFIQSKKVGFDKDQVLVVHNAHFLDRQAGAFRDEVLRRSGVLSGTVSGFLPVAGTWRNNNTFWPEGKLPSGADINDMISMQMWDVDHDYITTLGMKLKAGRDFSRDIPADSINSIIINEAAAGMFDFNDNAVGKKISYFAGTNPDGTPDLKNIRTLEIIGVVEDFHYESMRENIAPLALFLAPSNGYISFRYSGANTESVVKSVEQVWKQLTPIHSFEYSFLDEDFGRMYHSERRLGTIFVIFSSLAVIIACLGLFALTSFTARQRTKEIGIRKTLGASFESIIFLLTRSYGKLVLIAFAICIPLSWLFVHRWLESYSYKVDVGVMVYMLAGGLTFLIAILTVSYQSIRAASANPARSLRSE